MCTKYGPPLSLNKQLCRFIHPKTVHFILSLHLNFLCDELGDFSVKRSLLLIFLLCWICFKLKRGYAFFNCGLWTGLYYSLGNFDLDDVEIG